MHVHMSHVYTEMLCIIPVVFLVEESVPLFLEGETVQLLCNTHMYIML